MYWHPSSSRSAVPYLTISYRTGIELKNRPVPYNTIQRRTNRNRAKKSYRRTVYNIIQLKNQRSRGSLDISCPHIIHTTAVEHTVCIVLCMLYGGGKTKQTKTRLGGPTLSRSGRRNRLLPSSRWAPRRIPLPGRRANKHTHSSHAQRARYDIYSRVQVATRVCIYTPKNNSCQ